MHDVYGKTRGSLGTVTLNREHRYNMLSPNFIEEVTRGVETMNIDHNVDVIYLTTAKGQHFSIGTDFRTIAHMKKEGAYTRVASYLEELYAL
jgi:enoyl-CoA hydratase/carnithine racemase